MKRQVARKSLFKPVIAQRKEGNMRGETKRPRLPCLRFPAFRGAGEGDANKLRDILNGFLAHYAFALPELGAAVSKTSGAVFTTNGLKSTSLSSTPVKMERVGSSCAPKGARCGLLDSGLVEELSSTGVCRVEFAKEFAKFAGRDERGL